MNVESTLQRVFREVCRRGDVSLAALARSVAVRPSTAREKVRLLERKGLVEAGERGQKVGISAAFGHVVGIDLGASHLHYALADFRGVILDESAERVRPEDGPGKMIGQIKQGIRKLAGGRGRLRALAMGVPSPVDPKTGVVAYANNLPGWKNIHLGHELEKEFPVPLFMENDANMAALGEHWCGIAKEINNFVFIALGTGIGSGIFVDGKLYRGRTGAAGELYRVNVEWPRWEEDFGETGYFESHVSGQGIAADGRKALGPVAREEYASLAEGRDAYFVFQAFRRGDPRARAALEKIFTMLGVGVANLVAVLDPDLIVFGGGVVKGAPEFLLDTVEKVVRQLQPDPPPIRRSALEDKAQTYGAIFSALSVAEEAAIRRLA